MELTLTIMIVLFVYLLVMLWIGWYSSHKITSNIDFVIGGRRLGLFVIAGSLAATEIGGGSSLGVVRNGMSGYGLSASWYILTMGIAFVILGFMGPMLRRSAVKTVPEYFRCRYGRPCGLITAILMLLPSVGLTASQFIASAIILSRMLSMDYQVAVIVIAVVVIVYSIMGGFFSIALTDCLQIVLTIGGLLLALPFAIRYAGGWTSVKAAVPSEAFSLFSGYSGFDIISLIIMYVATFTVGQEAVSHLYAARNESDARRGAFASAAIHFLYAFIPTLLGIVILALIRLDKIDIPVVAADTSSLTLAVLAMQIMPPILCALVFTGILSATMSSSDSDLLGAGAVFANDIYKIYIRPEADDASVVRTTKITMCVVGVIAMIMALLNTQNLLEILTFCFAIRAAGAFFPYVLGHIWPRASAAATIASLLAGTAVVYAVTIFDGRLFGFYFSQPIIPGLLTSLLFFVVFAIIFPSRHTSDFFLHKEGD